MYENFMTMVMDVYGVTTGKDAGGGLTRNDVTPKALKVVCGVEDAGGDQVIFYGTRWIPITHRVFTQYASIVNGDELNVYDPTEEIPAPRKFRVIGIPGRRRARSSSLEDFFVLNCEEII